MSESARRIDGHCQHEAQAGLGPQELRRDAAPEVVTASPEQLVDDGSLNLATLLATRESLCRQADELASLMQVYDRAIATRSKSGEREIPSRDAEPKSDSAGFLLPPSTEHAARLIPRPVPEVEQGPSIIVCMQSLSTEEVSATPPHPPPVAAAKPQARRSRDAMAETIRFTVPVTPRRKGLKWTAGFGVVLLGLTMWAWLGVSLASSGESRTPTKVLPPVSTHAPATQPLPVILPFAAPAPEEGAALPGVSLSHFEVTWGDAPTRRVRVAMRRSISKMKACFAQTPRDALAFPHKVDMSLRVRESGTVKWVKGVRSGGSSTTQKCIESAVHDTFFPTSSMGLLVSAELVFRPM